jgi:hypothetical protein
MCAVVGVALAALALAVPCVRRVTSLLAAWLLVSAFVLHHAARATVWNNALVGLTMLVMSLIDGVLGPRRDSRTMRPA